MEILVSLHFIVFVPTSYENYFSLLLFLTTTNLDVNVIRKTYVKMYELMYDKNNIMNKSNILSIYLAYWYLHFIMTNYLLQRFVALLASETIFVPPWLLGNYSFHQIRLFSTDLAYLVDFLRRRSDFLKRKWNSVNFFLPQSTLCNFIFFKINNN